MLVAFHLKMQTVARMASDSYLTLAETASMLGVSEATVCTWQERNRIGCVGAERLVPKVDAERIANSPIRKATLEYAKTIDLNAPDEPLTEEDMKALAKLFTD